MSYYVPEVILFDPLETGEELGMSRLRVEDTQELVELVSTASKDSIMQTEFPLVIANYTSGMDIARWNVEHGYDKPSAYAIGYLILVGESAVGMTTIVPGNTLALCDDIEIPISGFNFSTWIAPNYRNKGIRSTIGRKTIEIGLSLVASSSDKKWHGTPWTAVRKTNAPSLHVQSKLGFTPIGVRKSDPEYLVLQENSL